MKYIPICSGVLVFVILAAIIQKLAEGNKSKSIFERKFMGDKTVGFLSIMALLIAYLAYLGTGTLVKPARVYFDNGYDIAYEVSIDGEPQGLLAAHQVTMLELSFGQHSIVISTNGETFETSQIKCTGDRDYIYNIGEFYIYKVVTYTYGPFNAYPTAHVLGSECFFRMPNVDYGLDERAPETIVVDANQKSDTRTALERTEK